MFDILIKGGRIVDGTGNPWFKADVAIKDGKIARIGQLEKAQAREVVDARGHVVSPGFIDVHSHSDFTIPFNPKADSSIRQGVTTLVVGNCGFSLAPVNRQRRELLLKYISPFLPSKGELSLRWSSFSEYLRYEERMKIAPNVVHLVGHGTVRIAVMGFEERAPTKGELEDMKVLVAEAMDSGAFGLSSGLIYPPGIYSETEELVELARVVAKYGGIYSSHIRGEGRMLIESVREAIEIGEKSGVPVEISHHKASGRRQWGKTKDTLAMMEDARVRGVDVTCDQYPYEAGMTSLVTLLPPWVHEGGMDQLLARLRSPRERERIRRDMVEGVPGWENFVEEVGWGNIYLGYVKTEKNKFLEGKSMAEIAKLKGKSDEFTVLFDLLLEEEGYASMVVFEMGHEDVERVMKHHLSMFGSDSWSLSTYDILHIGKPHPRFYGTYPRILSEYVREKSLLSLEEAIRKMTSLPAQRMGVWDRGLIKEGLWADIVVFDFENVRDRATYRDPHQYPEGIEYVLVNGRVVVDHGEHTDMFVGKVLRRRPTLSSSVLDRARGHSIVGMIQRDDLSHLS
ncbi:MAG: N-acyl-D-amino-acid deacylase family protein [Nitrososphaeria archaeon]